MYFSYHSIVQKGIKQGRLKSYYFDKNYKKIGYVMVLCFGKKKYPIREEKFLEYFELIGQFYKTRKKGDVFYTTPI